MNMKNVDGTRVPRNSKIIVQTTIYLKFLRRKFLNERPMAISMVWNDKILPCKRIKAPTGCCP